MQNKNFKPKEDKANHGLMIRAQIYLFFLLGSVRALRWRNRERNKRRRRKKEEEKKKKSRFGSWNSCLEISYSCLELWFGNFVWICWLGNPPNSLFAYVWGLKNPISV